MYEIEIKSLLKDKSHVDEIKNKMKGADLNFAHTGSHRQLNHYFINGNLLKLVEKLRPYIFEGKHAYFERIAGKAKDYSLRTRLAGDKVIFVLKVSVDDTTSFNGTARMEFESEVEMTLEELDQKILDCGFEYQAKWSREREQFSFKDLNVSIDKNAGYGYLAEFEKIIYDPDEAEETKQYIRQLLEELEVEELSSDRLERMFAHYNKNWKDYYGTEKVFVIE
jgi:predicted adenylyl cyclase CyaB